MNVTMYYLVRPKSILNDVVDQKATAFFTKPHLWEHQKIIGPDVDTTQFSISLVKLTFMLDLASNRNSSRFGAELKKLLEQPMKFSVDVFDQWWTIEEIGWHSSIALAIASVTSEDIDLLDMAGYDTVEEKIKSIFSGIDRF